MGGCDVTKFSEPMPWIGLYATAASLICSIAMAADAIYGFRRQKLWFPCRFFSLNATSLTLLSVATKLPLDINTSMPRRQDQLTKLTGTVLICTAMANLMPSLGVNEDSQVCLNVIALGILVVTTIVNVSIQMGTGVIYTFIPEHAAILFFMLVLFVILGSSALTVPTTKQLLEKQYELKHRQETDERQSKGEQLTVEKLKIDVKKYWMMAHTCSPQYVIGRSAICTASGAFSLYSAMVLTVALIKAYILGHPTFCLGESDYRWSSLLVLISQVIAVVVGTVAPACRWFNAINLRSTEKKNSSFRTEFRVELFWTQRLVEWKESLLTFHIHSRYFRKIAHRSKNIILDVCLVMQRVLILSSKFVRFISILGVRQLERLLSCICCRTSRKKMASIRSISNRSFRIDTDLKGFVLHLEGEEALVQLIMTSGCEDTEHWIQRGTKNQPIQLMNLLQKCTEGLNGVCQFESDQVPSIGPEEPPNCWALPLVTLTSIAVAVRCNDRNSIKPLLCGVNEGLRYVRLIEEKCSKGLINPRQAADMVWLGIDIHDRWLETDLCKLAAEQENDAHKIIEQLVEMGKKYVSDFEKSEKGPLEWPAKVLAANSMYRIGQSILQDYTNKFGVADKLFQWLEVTISDILGACITKLPSVISMKCFCSAVDAREESVREAACLLGETENILETLGKLLPPDFNPDVSINNWGESWKRFISSSPISSNSSLNYFSPAESVIDVE